MEILSHLLNNAQPILLIGLVFILAGMVKGIVGLGLPTVAIGLLSLRMPALEAAALLILPSLLTNVWQFASYSGLLPLIRRLRSMLLGICVGTFASALLLTRVDPVWSGVGLGLALISYALMGLTAVHCSVPPHAETWLAALTGIITGVVTATTGIFVMPSVPFLQALNLDKDRLIQALGLSFTVSTLALAINLGSAGTLRWVVAGNSLFAVIPAVIGMQLGQYLRNKIPALLFKRCFFSGLLALGIHYLWGAIAK